MVKKLVILGTSGNALDVMDVVEGINAGGKMWEVVGFLDDGKKVGEVFLGLPVLGGIGSAKELGGECWFLNAIGSDGSFRRRAEFVGMTGVSMGRFATLVHPMACVSARAILGAGVCVNFGASVAGNVRVAEHASIGPRAVVGHDSVIGAYAVVAAGAVVSGAVTVGRLCYIGAGSAIKQKVRVGDKALVGLGAVVVKDVAEGVTVVGNPARVLVKPA